MWKGKDSYMVDYKPFVPVILDSLSALRIGEDYGLNPGRDGRCRCIACHGSREDTLKLYPGDRGAYCFRCHRSWDALHLMMEITGMKFSQAVKELNDRYALGLPLEKPDPEKIRRAQEEAERRAHRREMERQMERQATIAMWDAEDAVYDAEQVLKNEGPKGPDEPFTERYLAAARDIEALREKRDRLRDRVYGNR